MYELIDLEVGPTRKLEPGMAEVIYSFQLRWGDLEAFLIDISRVHPRLCFILGTVAPSADQQVSCFIHRGSIQTWTLMASQKERIVAPVLEIMDRLEAMDNPSAEDEEEDLLASIQADGDMMEAVVDHWRVTATATRLQIAIDLGND